MFREKHTRKNRNTEYPTQDREYISNPTANIYHIFFRGGSWAGYPVVLLFYCCLFYRSFSVLCLCCFVVVLFSPSLVKLLHLPSKNHI